MTTTAMKRAGQLVAHLGILHQISDVRQLLLLQLSMRERQDQVVLFKRQGGAATLSLIGAQPSTPTAELTHRAGNASAGALFDQLQAISGISGDDVAFSGGQIAEMIAAQTQKIEASEALAKLDAALLSLVGKLELEVPQATGEQTEQNDGAAATDAEAGAAEAQTPEAEDATPLTASAEAAGSTPEEGTGEPEADTGLSSARTSRRRSA